MIFFAPCPKGIEGVLADELRGLGAAAVTPALAGVGFEGPLATGYRACLWSRTASRVVLQLARFPAPDPDALYDGVQAIDWAAHMDVGGTLAVDFTSSRSAITHTGFGALRTKDAIVDQFRDRTGRRPSVDAADPDLRVNVHVAADEAIVSVDISGGGLHRRGWRGGGGAAPLKENLAAATLLLAGWPDVAARGGALVDPMCGSGTLLVEGAWMAADVAPGLARERWGFDGWKGHDAAAWERLVAEARARDRRGAGDQPRRELPRIVGYDADPRAVRMALANVESAGLRGVVHVERRDLLDTGAVGDAPGLVVTNPPYGERIGERRALEVLYRRLGDVLKQGFPGWQAHVLTGNPELTKFVGLKVRRRRELYNGAIACRLLDIPLRAAAAPSPGGARAIAPDAPVMAFANRLEKNVKRLAKWARREGVTCYRLYDADIPEYALEIDRYEGWIHVQEHERPKSVDPVRAVTRLNDALVAIQEVLGVAPGDVFVKHRRRQKGRSQYRKLEESGELREVREGGHRFLVNLRDYFDTGLFLDHRPTRALVGELARGRDVLNLFAYTGTATVYAAKGGARTTTTVDLSNTYGEWAQRNLALNGVEVGERPGDRHRVIRADCLRWIERATGRYGLIFLDPPTFSNSKGMEGTFDVQRDHVALLRATARLLTPDGVLLFSNNSRRFRMDRDALEGLVVEDITKQTIPPDFARNPRIHNTWRVTPGSPGG